MKELEMGISRVSLGAKRVPRDSETSCACDGDSMDEDTKHSLEIEFCVSEGEEY